MSTSCRRWRIAQAASMAESERLNTARKPSPWWCDFPASESAELTADDLMMPRSSSRQAASRTDVRRCVDSRCRERDRCEGARELIGTLLTHASEAGVVRGGRSKLRRSWCDFVINLSVRDGLRVSYVLTSCLSGDQE